MEKRALFILLVFGWCMLALAGAVACFLFSASYLDMGLERETCVLEEGGAYQVGGSYAALFRRGGSGQTVALSPWALRSRKVVAEADAAGVPNGVYPCLCRNGSEPAFPGGGIWEVCYLREFARVEGLDTLANWLFVTGCVALGSALLGVGALGAEIYSSEF